MRNIAVQQLRKSFGAETILNGINLQVETGEIVVLFGASGSGKSVLLHCLSGAMVPDDGAILFDGVDVTDQAPEYRHTGMAFQNFALFPHMSAFDNIASPLEAQNRPADERKRAVEEIAELLKIKHVLSHFPRALSNGQKQRTALARALVSNPDILLLDDPLRNVDAKLRFEMRIELPRLLAGRGATVVYVTQDYKEAMAIADRIAVLQDGKIIQFATPAEVYTRPKHVHIARLFGDPAINLLECKIQGDNAGCFVTLSDQRIAIDQSFAAERERTVLLAFRPEFTRFTEHGIPVKIEAETPLNEKLVSLVTTLRGREIILSRPFDSFFEIGQQMHMTIDADRLLLFDSQTGQRLDPATSADGTA